MMAEITVSPQQPHHPCFIVVTEDGQRLEVWMKMKPGARVKARRFAQFITTTVHLLHEVERSLTGKRPRNVWYIGGLSLKTEEAQDGEARQQG